MSDTGEVGSSCQTCPIDCNKPPTSVEDIEDNTEHKSVEELCKEGCDYYKLRDEDYKKRHPPECNDPPPPDYYLDYGLKYCEKFTNETFHKLSPKGKEWLLKTRCNLQIYLEDGLIENPELELNSKEFRDFAFDTHPNAYLNAGLSDLPPLDLLDIATTVEPKEFTKGETWEQIVKTGWGFTKEKAKDGWEFTKKKAKDGWEFTKEKAKVIWEFFERH